MDGKGREGTYIFFSRRLGGQPGAGHKAQGAAAPCHSAGAAHAVTMTLFIPRLLILKPAWWNSMV